MTEADIFVLVWSVNAKASNWVGTELRAYLKRRVADQTLRIVPVMVDDTPLPSLVADYKGFVLHDQSKIEDIASQIIGEPCDAEIARRLQTRLLELTAQNARGDPLPFLVCPQCGATELKRSQQTDNTHYRSYYVIQCEKCTWLEWVEI